MTFWDFLDKAGLWTWIGIFIVVSLLSRIRLWKNTTHNHFHGKDDKK